VDWDGNISDPSQSFTFSTLPASCSVPQNVIDTNITTTEATILWDSNPAVISYNLLYRVADSISWTKKSITTNTVKLTGLYSDTKYEYHVQSVCQTGAGEFSPIA